MIGFIIGTFFGAILAIACFCAAFVMIAGKVNEGETPEKAAKKPPDPLKGCDLLAACRQQAEMANFWNYDGGQQTDSNVIAQEMYDKAGAKRGRK